MAQISLLLLVVFGLLFSIAAATSNEEQFWLEDGFYGPRLRRVPLAYHGENAYLQQLLSNLKPRFRRSL